MGKSSAIIKGDIYGLDDAGFFLIASGCYLDGRVLFADAPMISRVLSIVS